MRNRLTVLALACMAMILLSNFAFAAATRTWDGEGADNNWSTAANWSNDTAPVTADAVVFNSTSSKDSTMDSAFFGGKVDSIAINSGYAGTITLGKALTVVGAFAQNTGSVDAVSYNLTIGGTTTCSGGYLYLGSGTFQVGNANFTGSTTSKQTSTLKVNNSGNASTVTLTSGGNTYYILQLSDGGSYSNNIALADNTTVETLSLTGTTNNTDYGIRALGRIITVNGDLNISGNGLSRGTFNVAGNLNLSGGMIDGATINLTGDLNVTSGSARNGWGTINWNKTGNETWAPAGKLCNLTINKSRTVTMGSTLSASGIVLTTASTLDLSANNAYFTGGNTDLSPGTFTVTTGQITYEPGAAPFGKNTLNVGSNALHDFTFKSTNSLSQLTISSNMTVQDLFVIGTGMSWGGGYGLAGGANTITVNGNLNFTGGGISSGTYNIAGDAAWSSGEIDSGTFNIAGNLTRTGGTIGGGYFPAFVLNGSGAQTVTSTANSFRDFTVSNSSAGGATFLDSSAVTRNFVDNTASSKLYFTGGTTHTWSNVTLNGQAAGTRITLASADTSDWNFNVTTLTGLSYVNASHSNASGGIKINAKNGTNFDGGSNTNWVFNPTPEAPSNFTPSSSSTSGLVFTWTDNSTNEAGFRILDETNATKVNVASGETSVIESGLSENTQYLRKVQAYNDGGLATSAAVSKYTSIEAAADATYEGVTETSITIHSSTPQSNLSSGSSGLYFQNVDKGTNSGWIKTNTWTSSSLTAGTAYAFKITARNGDGVITTTLEASKSTAQVPIPEAPTNFSSVSSSLASLNYGWTDNSTNEAGFRILDGTNEATRVDAASGATSAGEGGLGVNTQYIRKVQAYNAAGASTSDSVSKYTSIEAAGGGTYEGISETSITVHSSNVPSNLSSGNSGIYFEITSPITANSGWIQTNTWTNSALTENTTYNFKITTRNGDGVITTTTDAGSQTTLQAPTPEAPTNFSSVSSSIASLNYVWTDNSTNEAGFRVLDGTDAVKVNAVAGATSTGEASLSANTQYTRKVQAYNITGASTSAAVSKYTSIEASAGATWEGITSSSIIIHSINEPSNLGTGDSGLYFENTTAGTNSGWIKTNTWTSSGLSAATSYAFKITARNGDGTVSTTLDAGSKSTLSGGGGITVNTPEAAAFTSVKQTMITANWKANGNPATFEYYSENITAGTNSGWTTALSWESTGLAVVTGYAFRVKARSSGTNESGWRDLGSVSTEAYVTAEASVAGVALKDGDTISGALTLTVSLTTEGSLVVFGGIRKVYVDGVEVTYDLVSSTLTSVTIRLRDALPVGTHAVKIIIYDTSGTEYMLERTGLVVMSGGVITTGPTLVYPNPYNPLAGNLKITYYLSIDKDISIYVIDTSGRLVWKSNYLSGANGGKAGYNEILWDGVGIFGALASDAYIVNVIEQGTGRLITKTKLLIWKGGAAAKKQSGNIDFALISLLALLGLTIGGASFGMYDVVRKIKK